MKSIHSIWILLLLSLDTLFAFPSSLLWYTTGAAVRAVCAISPQMMEARGLERVTWRWMGCGLTPSKASITIWHVMALALFENQLICKKSCGVRKGKGEFLEWRQPFLCVIGDSPHVCEAAFTVCCLYRWETQRCPGKQWIEIVSVYAYTVLF